MNVEGKLGSIFVMKNKASKSLLKKESVLRSSLIDFSKTSFIPKQKINTRQGNYTNLKMNQS